MRLLDALRSAAAPLRRPAWVRTAINLFGHRQRRSWTDGRRAHIELRALDAERFVGFADAVEATFSRAPGIDGVRLNGELGRAIVSYDPTRWDPERLMAAFAAIEARLSLDELPFCEAIPDYPADVEPVVRKAVDLGADAIGVLLGSALRMIGYSPSRAGFDLAALMTVVDNTPRLRQTLVDRLGNAATEVGLGVTNAFVQAVGAGPVGPLADMLVQIVKFRAERARRRAWRAREPELCGAGMAPWERHPPVSVPPRPQELPQGVVERYTDEALFASLGAFVVGLADTRSLESSVAPLFGGLPKAALYGRTVFAAELMRTLGSRGALVMRTSALRLLDRVDAVVIADEVLVGDERAIAAVDPAPGADPEEARSFAHALFDGKTWSKGQVQGAWRLRPAESGGDRLTLTCEDREVATVTLRRARRRGADALLIAARRSRLHLVIASDDAELARTTLAHERVPLAELAATIRGLQGHGRVILLIAGDRPAAQLAADVGVGMVLRPGQTPWSADVIVDDDLAAAAFLVDAAVAARGVAEQSVVMAGIGAALGAALSLGGLKKTKPQQVMLATHAASVVALAGGLRSAVALARRPPPPQADPTPWHRLTIEEVLARLRSSEDGLAEDAASRRRRPLPAAPSRPTRILRAIAAELVNPLTPVLMTGAALSAVTGSLVDAGLIAGVFALNGAIGGIERYQAEGAIAALERHEIPQVRVCRGGAWSCVAGDTLVPGDRIEVVAGEVVPADCRLHTADDLEVDESSLTGESLPVRKDAAPSHAEAIAERRSMLYEGTAIAAGRAEAIVVATGPDTEARRGAVGLHEMSPETGVEARLRRLTEATLPIAGLSGALLVGAGLFRHQDLHRLVDLGVSMAVAAVPEGMPLLATVAQLAAARRLGARGALVRNPRTVEALGRLDVLCADKTGTLTEGIIELHGVAEDGRIFRGDEGEAPTWARLLLAAALRASPAAPARGELPHPTDRAVVDGAREAGVAADEGRAGWTRIHDLPFEPGRGYHGALGRDEAGLWISVKGAPEVLLPRCTHRRIDGRRATLGAGDTAAILRHADELAAGGLRVLAVAEREASETRDLDDDRIGRLCFCGFILLADPPRASAAAAIDRLGDAGVELVMITGDHPATSRRIADELGLLRGRRILTGPEIEAMNDDALGEALVGVAVVARATPAHKVRIVKALQRAGKVVGMTGDGANDAAAIRLADVGIAVGARSTVAARDAADLIVTGERIEIIVDAIAEGRAMWKSVRDAVSILSGGNLGEIGFALFSGLLGGESPLNARQLLLVNLLTDVAPAMAIALRAPSEAAMAGHLSEGPEVSLGEALDRDIAMRAITTATGAATAWLTTHLLPGGRRSASTVGLLALVGSQLGQTLISGAPTPAIIGASLGSAALMLAVVETPIVSHLFGCRPVGPIGLGVALGGASLATGASVVLPPAIAWAQRRWRARERWQPPPEIEVRLGDAVRAGADDEVVTPA